MARKTICPSRFIPVLGLLALVAVPTASAQEAQRPSSHTVRRGDTLWDIAARYLGDPFQWPQIYRINTDVVEDPHWIYPGEVLRLVAAEGARAVPAEDTPAPGMPGPEGGEMGESEYEYPMPEFAQRRRTEVGAVLQAYTEQVYRPLRPGEFHSSGFLTEQQRLPFGRMHGPVTPQQIRNLSERTSASPFGAVAIEAPNGASYAPGDSLLVVQLGDEFRGYGEAVIPTGLVRVERLEGRQYLATVVAVYGPMRNGQLVLPAERFSPGPERRAVAVTDGPTGEVIGARELRELKHPQNVMFVSLGRRDGVQPGDVIEMRRAPGPRNLGPDLVDELMATGQVVRVGDRTATVVLLGVVSPDIPPGTPVRLVGRLPAGGDR